MLYELLVDFPDLHSSQVHVRQENGELCFVPLAPQTVSIKGAVQLPKSAARARVVPKTEANVATHVSVRFNDASHESRLLTVLYHGSFDAIHYKLLQKEIL